MEDTINSLEHLSKEFPVVTLAFDKEQDIWKITHFLGDTDSAGANFQQRILEQHPLLRGVEKLPRDKRIKEVRAYVDKYYEENVDQLTKSISGVSTQWDSYSPIFYQNTKNIFKSLKWPAGEYKGFVSISSPCPRFLDRKTFQVPTRQKHSNYVIAHELLHFIFYEYVRKRYTPQLPNTLEKEMDRLLENKFKVPLWELSEVFNVVVLSQPEFGKEISSYGLGYSALKQQLQAVQEQWEKSEKDIDVFFSRLEAH